MIYSPPSKHKREEARGERKGTSGGERGGEGGRGRGSPLESLHLHALEFARLMFWKTRIGKSRMLQMALRDWIWFEKDMYAF